MEVPMVRELFIEKMGRSSLENGRTISWFKNNDSDFSYNFILGYEVWLCHK